MPELYPTQSNHPDFPVQPEEKGYFAKLELVPEILSAETGLSADSKDKGQQAYKEMIQRVIALEDSGDYAAANSLRQQGENFRNENGLEQVDESKLPGPDGTAAPDIDKHAA